VTGNGVATPPARRLLHGKLLERVDVRALEGLSRAERRLRVREQALGLMREEGHILPRESLSKLVNEVSDEVVGLGPIEFLLKDPEVTEVMVNGADDVYVERKGRIERVQDGLFEGEEAVLHVIERIVAPLGLRVDESSPYADARLPDGSRVQTERRRNPLGEASTRGFTDYLVEPPAAGDALKLMLASVFEAESATGDEILHGLRDEHFGCTGSGSDARADGDGEPPDVVAVKLDLTRVQTSPHLKPKSPHPLHDGLRAIDSAGRTVERGEEPVAHRLDLAAAEPRELGADDAVVLLPELPPFGIANRSLVLG